jgi:RHS repeat-associated protein
MPNGNMIKDRNKGISNIRYNHLNLPTQIEFEGTNNKITYLYNSVGQKLKKTVVYSDSIKIVDYLDGFQYAGNILQFFPHAEGYVKVTPIDRLNTNYAFNYVFNYTDHLGNVRLSYSKDPRTNQLKILEENHYYPFGLKHSVYSAGRLRDFEVDSSNPEGEQVFLTPVTKTEYQYKYNGQEWQDELGLNMYAMDLRQYDPAIGRWVAQDPVTHFDYSPYSAFDNNPVFWADPSGADAVDIGYDRIIDSQDMMGSYHWSGGFQEIENEGGGETETQKANSSASEQRNSFDNVDDPPGKEVNSSVETDNYIYNFKAGNSYDIKIVRRVPIGTPGGSFEEITISVNEENISTGYNYSNPSATLSPRFLKGSLFLKTHSSTVTFHQNVSGNSLQEIFNQTDKISNVTTGAVIYYNYIEGTRNGKLFWDAHQKGHGLAVPLDATVFPQKPIFK